MRNLLALTIATCCLAWLPTQAQAAGEGKAGRVFRDCPDCPEMVIIPTGSVDIGSPNSESGRNKDEGPVHRVKVASFALGKTEITRSQFAEFITQTKYSTGDKCWTLEKGSYKERVGDWRKPGYKQTNKHPVTCVNWNDAQAYTKWLSRKTGGKYRLPTEAEWEYAARGNTSTARYWGTNPDDAWEYANGADKTAQLQIEGATSWSAHDCTDGYSYTAPVNSFKANTFGLHDMLGNVWEWTQDNYHDNYNGAPIAGGVWIGGSAKRVLRGGSWNNSPSNLRAAIRYKSEAERRFSSFGFRLARAIP